MTVSAKIDLLRQLPAFKECSEVTLDKLIARCQVVRFGIGQPLNDPNLIPDRVLLILSGKARLLGRHNNQLNTLAILGPGNLVGLPSLLRAEGCEAVSASTEVDALAVPDALVAEIYSREISFRLWCNSNVFLAEVAALCSHFSSKANDRPSEFWMCSGMHYP